MFWAEFFIGILFAAIFTIIFATILKKSGPWGSPLIFFIVVLLASYAISRWMLPVGPVVWGIYWIPLFWIALIVSLLLAAVTPPSAGIEQEQSTGREISPAEKAAESSFIVLNAFFWIFLIVILLAIIMSFF
ncbi:MAG: hypothetical protein ACOCUT_01380 [bacterium]